MLNKAPYLSANDPPSKRRILEAALRLFAQKGYDAVSIRDIAAASGYSNPALFKFFSTKEALALHLFETSYLHLFDALQVVINGEENFADKVKAMLKVFLLEIDQRPDAFLFVQDHLRLMWPRVSMKTRKKSILAAIHTILEKGVREGAVNPSADTELLTAAISGVLQQFARMKYFEDFKKKTRNWLSEMETLVQRMIAP